ncbi:MAG: succinate-semialdehyde dehydrogenase [Balneola sp.]|jgi:succinate-semialdehyde dehydrogenase / glutarate-semialdehyde dehydrogenase|nr:succinate-semialdehyde dehydrogenase [Balneola sp.]MAO76305.1 succinate-semialdehyde dehydrogenase [Balneola sp.]MBF65496.1 succinate-semialdehyde dehydrogenase [Balneola sp.]|tara:strand:+ start:5976 stop:7337 length:1362 start_codon:yes stop_codon:yes gene_type:complete
MKTINPATGKVIKEYSEMSFEEVSGIIYRANIAQKQWKDKSFTNRSVNLNKIAKSLKENKQELGELMSTEMGKPLSQSIGEIEKCAWVCEYYAENAEDFLSDDSVETDASKSYVTFNPLGTVLSIMPWNFPFWQLFRFAAPALMAGNAVILSHSENVTGCALEIEKIIHTSGIPADLFRTILVQNENMKPVIQHNGIAAVTLTGSTRAGKIVASQAGEALKKTVLELGGSDPSIILADADIKQAAESCVNSRTLNSGQSCIAAKRFVVVEEVYDEFVSEFKKLMESKKVGDPFDEATDIGPMAREDLRDGLHEQVQKSIEAGANCILGGEKPGAAGSFYPVTILENVTKGMPAYDEELFGPVASIIKVQDEEEAVQVANDSIYGLGASIYSKDVEKAEKIAAEQLEAGCCFVNEFVKSDPRLPFGGIKQSGYGRELGLYGIREFVNTKTVYVK